MGEAFDIVVVGSGPASAFFLHAWLARAPKHARALVLEAGPRHTHAERLAEKEDALLHRSRTRVSGVKTGDKNWRFAVALGGSAALWWACTPRFLPADFELKSRYGRGRDWPLSYDELEPYYGEVEALMGISGDSEDSPFARSTPYPLGPHSFSDPERALKRAYPEAFFHQPNARPTRAIGKRPACCANGVCGRCPIDSKFTVLNGLAEIFDDPRVSVWTDSPALAVEVHAGVARGVRVKRKGKELEVRAEVVALGAGAFFNPYLLLRSGLDGPAVGRGLHEQASVRVFVDLDGMEGFQGSSSITGHGYMLYDGEHRRERAGCLIETWNVPHPRLVPGKLRSIMWAQFLYEDLPQEHNRVIVDPEDESKPKIEWQGRSPYVLDAIARAQSDAEQVFSPLPLDGIRLHREGKPRDTEGHALGTTRMGRDPADVVVDRELKHHQVRNLLVLGGSTFPSSGPANPTLTLSALSRWAADRL